MNPLTLLLLFTLSALAAADNSTYTPRDEILLDCGASGSADDNDGRSWDGDTRSKYNPTLTSAGLAAPPSSAVPQVPYLTARIFTSNFTYSFPLGAGRKFLRLHFYPSNYPSNPSLSAENGLFAVTANSYTLLSNFSAYQTAQALNSDYLVREFSLNVSDAGLNLTFTPSVDHPNSFAFINGIEIISMPDLFTTAATGIPLLVNGSGVQTQYTMDPQFAFQTVYRLNVGGQPISPSNDSGLFRSWDDDSPYIYGAGFGVTYSIDGNVSLEYPTEVPGYIAPANVYSTARSMGPDAHLNLNYNLTWIFSVDAGFYYLFRFHFCEIQSEITKVNQRVFDIYLNNQTAQEQADIIYWGGGLGKPWYKDYVAITSGSGLTDLWVALHPDVRSKPEYYDAILNGLEIFKIDTNGNLAGPNPPFLQEPNVDPSKVRPKSSAKSSSKAPATAGGAAGGVVLLQLLVTLFYFVPI